MTQIHSLAPSGWRLPRGCRFSTRLVVNLGCPGLSWCDHQGPHRRGSWEPSRCAARGLDLASQWPAETICLPLSLYIGMSIHKDQLSNGRGPGRCSSVAVVPKPFTLPSQMRVHGRLPLTLASSNVMLSDALVSSCPQEADAPCGLSQPSRLPSLEVALSKANHSCSG